MRSPSPPRLSHKKPQGICSTIRVPKFVAEILSK
jgi:hypothetical protein